MDVPKEWSQGSIYKAPFVADTFEQLAARVSQWNSASTSIVRTWTPHPPLKDIEPLLAGVPLRPAYEVVRATPSKSPIVDGYFECIQLTAATGGVDPRRAIAEFVTAELAHDPVRRLERCYGPSIPPEYERDERFHYIDYGGWDSGTEGLGFGLFAQDLDYAGSHLWVWSRFVHFHK